MASENCRLVTASLEEHHAFLLRKMGLSAGHLMDDPEIEVFYWVRKDFRPLSEIGDERLKDKALVWYEYDIILNKGLIGKDLIWLTRFHEHLKKQWDGALVEHPSRRDALVRVWFTHITREVERAHAAWQQCQQTQAGADEVVEKPMDNTHLQ